MADRYAVASGNWSAPATWDGGATIPVAGDVVRPNTYTVTIDGSQACQEIRHDAGGAAAAGGSFVLADGATFTGNVQGSAQNTTLLTFSAASPATATINGNVTQAAIAATLMTVTGTGTLTINGNITSGNASGARAMAVSVSATIIVVGNLQAGTANTAYCINVTAGAPAITITGNVTAGAGSSAGVLMGSGGTLTITGNVTGGSAAGAHGVNAQAACTIYVTGDVIAATGNGIQLAATASYVRVTGDLYASSATYAAGGTGAAVLSLRGNLYGHAAGTWPAFFARFIIHSTDPIKVEVYDDDGAFGANVLRPLYTANHPDIDQPANADVRSGVVYADGAETGACAVPDPAYVSIGVPVDATVGALAHLDAAGIRAAVGLAAADLDTQLDAILSAIDPAAIWQEIIETEGNITAQQAMSVMLAIIAGVRVGAVFKTPNGNATRATITITGNDRTASTLTPSS